MDRPSLLPVTNHQILVLKNGEILEGQIEQNATKLIVHTRQGSRLVIAKAKADFICESISEAYWGKSARIRASDTNAQIQLFRWCLKHRLLDHAESQLDILMQCDVSKTQMVLLSRQFDAMLKARSRPKTTVQPASETPQPKRLANSTMKPERLFQPLPSLGNPDVHEATAEQQSDLTLSTDGKVIPASFISPTPKRPGSNRLRKTQARQPNRPSFSSPGSIPDLSRARRLTAKMPASFDPYDAAIFNSKTESAKSD
jgi:hypothetical protein